MMRFRTGLSTLLAGCALVAAAAVHAQAREEARLLTAGQVLSELRSTRDQSIPDRLLDRAYGIAVIPDLTKAAFFFGGRRGRGVLVVRDKNGRFSNPAFITMTGGSFGWQWGVQQTDIVLVFTTPRGIEGINGGKLTLGANASVAAGPVGRDGSAGTDATFRSEIYSYSRSRGVFAGLALDGTVLSMDDKANAEFYKKPGVTAGDILAGNVTSDDEAIKRFMTAVHTSTGGTTPQRTASVTPPAATGGTAASPSAAPSGAQSFPLSDPQPGREPH